jgi:hypothetical protein
MYDVERGVEIYLFNTFMNEKFGPILMEIIDTIITLRRMIE